MFKINLMPREAKFFDLFEASAKNMVKAAEIKRAGRYLG